MEMVFRIFSRKFIVYMSA